MTKSEALFIIVRAAYEAAEKVDPEHRDDFLARAVALDSEACDARDEEAAAVG